MNKRQYKKKCKKDFIRFTTNYIKSPNFNTKLGTDEEIEAIIIKGIQNMFQEIADNSFGKSKVSVNKLDANSGKLNVNIEPEKPIELYYIGVDCSELGDIEVFID